MFEARSKKTIKIIREMSKKGYKMVEIHVQAAKGKDSLSSSIVIWFNLLSQVE